MSNSTEAFATRLPAEDAERLKELMRTKGWNEAEAVRQIIQDWLDEDPDNILSPDPLDSVESFGDSLCGTRE